MAKGDGIESKGKTKGKQLGIDGASLGVQNGGKGGSAKSVTSANMKKFGRNLARAKNQGG
jgi:hypothetical protein